MIRLLNRAEKLRDRHRNPDGYRSAEADKAEKAYLHQRDRAMRVEGTVPDPTALLVIDEADRLRVAGLEQVRDIFDRGSFGLVLIGMPGMEKRLARYPQFYSRIGFVHEFRPLGAKEIRQLLDQHWTPPGVQLPQHPLDLDTAAAIIRITGGNFRLLSPDRTDSRNQCRKGADQNSCGSGTREPGDRAGLMQVLVPPMHKCTQLPVRGFGTIERDGGRPVVFGWAACPRTYRL